MNYRRFIRLTIIRNYLVICIIVQLLRAIITPYSTGCLCNGNSIHLDPIAEYIPFQLNVSESGLLVMINEGCEQIPEETIIKMQTSANLND